MFVCEMKRASQERWAAPKLSTDSEASIPWQISMTFHIHIGDQGCGRSDHSITNAPLPSYEDLGSLQLSLG